VPVLPVTPSWSVKAPDVPTVVLPVSGADWVIVAAEATVAVTIMEPRTRDKTPHQATNLTESTLTFMSAT
jgi:hypothetical protein